MALVYHLGFALGAVLYTIYTIDLINPIYPIYPHQLHPHLIYNVTLRL